MEKHADRSIDALAILRARGYDIRLAVAGDGPRGTHLRRRAAELPVDFLGHLTDRQKMAALLASADIALAPGPHETFGLAALEALASGTAVVVSHSSALTEIVTPRCGAAAPDTAEGFADAIESVLEHSEPDRRSAARARAEHFGWPHAVDAMIDAWSRSDARPV